MTLKIDKKLCVGGLMFTLFKSLALKVDTNLHWGGGAGFAFTLFKSLARLYNMATKQTTSNLIEGVFFKLF